MITPSGYTSVYGIIERVLRISDTENINISDFVRHIADALLFIGSHKYMETKFATVEIENNRGELPCDIVSINQTRYVDNNGNYFPLRYATESFHSKWHDANSCDLTNDSELTYSLNGDMIYTSFKEGKVEIDYKGLATDEKGYPLIPNDIKFTSAVEYHLLFKIHEPLWLLGKTATDKFQYIQQQRDWYVAAAQSRGNMPSHDQMASLANQLTRLIEVPFAHSNFYSGLQNPENIKKHP